MPVLKLSRHTAYFRRCEYLKISCR